jgi:hypothetical protein
MVMPLRERLGLDTHQSLSPVLEDRLCHLAITSTSYHRAAEVAGRFGIETDDSQIQRLVQRMGKHARENSLRRIEDAFAEGENNEAKRILEPEVDGKGFSLVLMLDGTMVRFRGEDWGKKPSSLPGERVRWREVKAGIVIRLPEEGQETGRRASRSGEKYYVAGVGSPDDIGRRLYAEALRRGLPQARRVYVIADGAVWIWRLSEKYFPGALEELDYYHASEHLWALGRDLFGDDESAVRDWVVPLLKNLKHHGGRELLELLEELVETSENEWDEKEREVLSRETAYFQSHSGRLGYDKARQHGFPIGSGAMESTCAQLQGRFKRTGQFWSMPGEENLLELELAWRNRDWNDLWAA